MGVSYTVIGVVLFGMTMVSGQLISNGTCPNILPLQDFNLQKYAGRWYEMEKYWFIAEATASCITVEYYPDFFTDINLIEGVTQTNVRIKGHTRFATANKSIGNVTLDLEEVNVNQSNIPFTVVFPYLILSTDYSTYTIKYSCIPLGSLKMEGMWILSKAKKFYNAETRAKVRQIVKQLGLKTHPIVLSATRKQCPW